jgi:formate dehydrogenase subunit gamma
LILHIIQLDNSREKAHLKSNGALRARENAPMNDPKRASPDGPFDEKRALALISGLSGLQGATLPILHALQGEFGYVDQRAVPLIADALNLSRAEIHGAVSFYHDFKSAPRGRHVLKICRAEACQAMGVEKLVDRLAIAHRLEPGGTSADGGLTIEAVYCLGNCALSPSALLDGEPLGRLDEAKIDEIVTRHTGARA